jgi:hypothetical protein
MTDNGGERRVGTAAGPGSPAADRPTPLLNDIRDLARKKWEAAGKPPGDGARFWLEAEQAIRQVR